MKSAMLIHPLFDLSGKVAVVTGAASGIGQSTAQQLAAHGARVVVSAPDAAAGEAVAAEIKADWAEGSGDAMAIACDTGDRDQCHSLIDRTISVWGRIDILVCNGADRSDEDAADGMAPDAAWDRTMTAQVRGNLWLTGRACPDMASRKDGAVILIGSADGLRGVPGSSARGMAAAATAQLARDLAVEWGPHNIRANCVAPSLIQPDGAETPAGDPSSVQTMQWTYPMQRLGKAEDVSGAVVALAGPAGAWMSGQTIVIDGGMMAGSGREEG
tara:strand:- start:1432 stop:2247 length:816 start_codon:yes stop_codon:yes gene_type:complete